MNQGYPVTFVLPGVSGLVWDKWVVSMDFNAEAPNNDPWLLYDTVGMKRQFQGTICAGWFSPNKDGHEAKVGQPVDINGYAFLDNYKGHELAEVAFSTDYGKNWTTVAAPGDFDQKQWTYFEGTWTPEEVGACILQVKAIDKAGDEDFGSIVGCACATNGPGGGAIANAEVQGVALATIATLTQII